MKKDQKNEESTVSPLSKYKLSNLSLKTITGGTSGGALDGAGGLDGDSSTFY